MAVDVEAPDAHGDPMTYRALDPDHIVATLEILSARIAERFPGASLAGVAGELTGMARESAARADRLERPSLLLRVATAAVIGVGLIGVGGLLSVTDFRGDTGDFFSLVSGVDAAVSLLIVIGGAVYFLVSIEDRLKRAAALEILHELRSIIHVIDMHQLTKDPSALARRGPRTANSPERTMTSFELTRYLDYCSELLSLTAKVAAVYAQSSRDAAVIDAASDLAALAADLNLKIWQKISLIDDGPGRPD